MGWAQYQQDFYNQMYPLAQKASQATGIDPDIIFAQAALESNWGRSAPNNNYFGIKGGTALQSTKEYINGKWVTIKDAFRGYGSMADAVQGYVDLMKGSSRYTGVRVGASEWAQLNALQGSGYATDPNYTSKLKSIMSKLPGGSANSGTITGAIGEGVDAVVNGATSVLPTGPVDFIKSVFNGELAGRFAAVIIGIILIGLAIAAFVLLSDTGKEMASSAVKAAA